MTTIYERRDEPGWGRFPKAVFKLDTADGGAAYMSVSRTTGLNEERSVVEVDAAKFVAICSDVSNKTQAWQDDYKFAQAVAGYGIAVPRIAVGVACADPAFAGASVQLYTES